MANKRNRRQGDLDEYQTNPRDKGGGDKITGKQLKLSNIKQTSLKHPQAKDDAAKPNYTFAIIQQHGNEKKKRLRSTPIEKYEKREIDRAQCILKGLSDVEQRERVQHDMRGAHVRHRVS